MTRGSIPNNAIRRARIELMRFSFEDALRNQTSIPKALALTATLITTNTAPSASAKAKFPSLVSSVISVVMVRV